MRLQGAIFSIEDAVLNHEGLDKALSLLKMEGVWLYAVTDMERADAISAVEERREAAYFRGVLTARETGCAADEAKMFEKAARRLRSEPETTAVFAGRPLALRNAKAAGFRTVAVAGAASPEEWAEMKEEADEAVECYREFFS